MSSLIVLGSRPAIDFRWLCLWEEWKKVWPPVQKQGEGKPERKSRKSRTWDRSESCQLMVPPRLPPLIVVGTKREEKANSARQHLRRLFVVILVWIATVVSRPLTSLLVKDGASIPLCEGAALAINTSGKRAQRVKTRIARALACPELLSLPPASSSTFIPVYFPLHDFLVFFGRDCKHPRLSTCRFLFTSK